MSVAESGAEHHGQTGAAVAPSVLEASTMPECYRARDSPGIPHRSGVVRRPSGLLPAAASAYSHSMVAGGFELMS